MRIVQWVERNGRKLKHVMETEIKSASAAKRALKYWQQIEGDEETRNGRVKLGPIFIESETSGKEIQFTARNTIRVK